jgi:PHD/YefM family antitoxin component YafN of YafNO toxin-antitoxin module
MADERWSVVRAIAHFDELLDQVITTRKPVFVDGERGTAVFMSKEEWGSIQDKLIAQAPSDL